MVGVAGGIDTAEEGVEPAPGHTPRVDKPGLESPSRLKNFQADAVPSGVPTTAGGPVGRHQIYFISDRSQDVPKGDGRGVVGSLGGIGENIPTRCPDVYVQLSGRLRVPLSMGACLFPLHLGPEAINRWGLLVPPIIPRAALADHLCWKERLEDEALLILHPGGGQESAVSGSK